MTKKKLNWVDYTIIVVVLLAIALLCYQYVSVKNATATLENEKDVYMTILLSTQPDYVVDHIEEGAQVRYNVKEKDMGEIVSAEITPAEHLGIDTINGTFELGTVPEKYDATVVVRADGKEAEDAIYAGHLKVAVGQSITIRDKDFAAAGYILSLDVQDKQ